MIGAVLDLGALALALAAVRAQEPVLEARVVLEAGDGSTRSRPLAGFDTADPRQAGGLLVRFEGLPAWEPPAPDPERAEVSLVGGGRASGLLAGGAGEALELELAGGARLELSVDQIERLLFPGHLPAAWTGTLEPAAEGDVLYRRRGGGLDAVRGGLESFSPQGVRFDGRALGSKLYPWSEVCALLVEVLDAGAATAPRGVPVVVDLYDGGRLRGGLERLSSAGCRLLTGAGRGLSLPLETVAEVLVEDDSLRFLSELAPARALDASPFGDELGMRWPHRVDRCVSGAPLTAGGRTWTRGIGVHAPSLLAWKLGGSWKTLRGHVAVDDEVLRLAARGSVVFRLTGDGRELWASPVLRGGDPPLALPALALAGVDELVLEVDMAQDLHVADRADWLRLVLVK